jgi:hypothetical protein
MKEMSVDLKPLWEIFNRLSPAEQKQAIDFAELQLRKEKQKGGKTFYGLKSDKITR